MSAESALKPATRWTSITPSDTDDVTPSPRSLYVAAIGDAVLMDEDGNLETFPVAVGAVLPLRPRRVMVATTATLIAIW